MERGGGCRGCDDNDDAPCGPIRLMVRIMMVGVRERR